MTQDDIDNFDDLLGLTPDDEPIETVVEEPVKAAPKRKYTRAAPKTAPKAAPKAAAKPAPAEVVEDPLDAQIRMLQEQIAEPDEIVEEDDDEDPEEVAKKNLIKALQDQLTEKKTNAAENGEARLVKASGPGVKKIIHFEQDGFTGFGTLWYRGQELEYTEGGEVYKRTQDSVGDSWLDLAGDRPGQIRKWGKVYFEVGPFVSAPGEKFDDDISKEDARRGRAVPIIKQLS